MNSMMILMTTVVMMARRTATAVLPLQCLASSSSSLSPPLPLRIPSIALSSHHAKLSLLNAPTS